MQFRLKFLLPWAVQGRVPQGWRVAFSRRTHPSKYAKGSSYSNRRGILNSCQNRVKNRTNFADNTLAYRRSFAVIVLEAVGHQHLRRKGPRLFGLGCEPVCAGDAAYSHTCVFSPLRTS
jgi:hypothetical protein